MQRHVTFTRNKGSSELKQRQRQTMEAAKKQTKEAKETCRGRGNEYKGERQRHSCYCRETDVIPRICYIAERYT